MYNKVVSKPHVIARPRLGGHARFTPRTRSDSAMTVCTEFTEFHDTFCEVLASGFCLGRIYSLGFLSADCPFKWAKFYCFYVSQKIYACF